MKPVRTHAITLVELLVCIVAVSIAAALAFPVLGRATQRGRLAACSSQLKDITAAAILYTADYDDRTLATGLVSRGDASRMRWYQAVLPYGVETESLVCPSMGLKDLDRVRVSTDYLLNDHFAVSERWSSVSDLGQRILFAERAQDVDMDSYMPWRGEHLVVVERTRHGASSNYAFADGHVRRLAFGHTISPIDLHWIQEPPLVASLPAPCEDGPVAPII